MIKKDDVYYLSTSLRELSIKHSCKLDFKNLAWITYGGDANPYQDIENLSAGHYMEIWPKKINRNHILNKLKSNFNNNNFNENANELRRLIVRSVEKRGRHFSSIGLLLSGGVDSTALAYALAECGYNFTCYTWDASNFCDSADESHYATETARYLGANIKYIDIGKFSSTDSLLFDPTWIFKAPYTHSCYRFILESAKKMSQDGIDCCMTGLYGDWVMKGNLGSLMELFTLNYKYLSPWLLLKLMIHGYSCNIPLLDNPLNKNNTRLLAEINTGVITEAVNMQFQPNALTNHGIDFYTTDAVDAIVSDNVPTPISLLLYSGFCNIYNPLNIYFTAPYLSYELMCFRESVPNYQKLSLYGGRMRNKIMQRKAFQGKLPKSITSRMNKQVWDIIFEVYVLPNTHIFNEILTENSQLVKLGILSKPALNKVFASETLIRRCTLSLFDAAMSELWLRSEYGES